MLSWASFRGEIQVWEARHLTENHQMRAWLRRRKLGDLADISATPRLTVPGLGVQVLQVKGQMSPDVGAETRVPIKMPKHEGGCKKHATPGLNLEVKAKQAQQ